MDTVFKKIIERKIPAEIVYEDDLCLAFHDANPCAPVHILLIPKITVLDRLSSATEDHQLLLGHLLLKANKIAQTLGLNDFRIVSNNGAGAGQSVFHLHFHIMGGRNFSWPPG